MVLTQAMIWRRRFQGAGFFRHLFKFPRHLAFQNFTFPAEQSSSRHGFQAFRSGTDKFHHPFVFSLGDLKLFSGLSPSALFTPCLSAQFHITFLDALKIISGTK